MFDPTGKETDIQEGDVIWFYFKQDYVYVRRGRDPLTVKKNGSSKFHSFVRNEADALFAADFIAACRCLKARKIEVEGGGVAFEFVK